MSIASQAQSKVRLISKPSFTPGPTGLLQRQCACGGSPGLTGQYMECQNKRLTLQLRSTNQAKPSQMPPIVHEVLRSSGQPLDPSTRAFMESRFGHDFSQVRVHCDSRAAESARAVNALAYTVGRDVVFGAGGYAPRTMEGKWLLAHELTHTLQQPHAVPGRLRLAPADDAHEREAAHTADQVMVGAVPAYTPAPGMMQRACGPEAIGSVAGCVGRDGDIETFGESSADLYLFQVGCDDFQPGEEARLRDYAAGIGPGDVIEIDGFASEEGGEEFNENLSCVRAQKVAAVLIKEGVSPSQIETVYKHGGTPGFRMTHRSAVITIRSAVPEPELAPEPAPETEPRPRRQAYPRVTVWVNSFIPDTQIDGPPGSECFTGDNRAFSSDPNTSSRTHQLIEVKAGESAPLANIRRIGTSHEVDCDTGAVLDSDTASIDELSNRIIMAVRTSADANIYFTAAASNPLVLIAPAIDLQAAFFLNLVTRQGRFEIEHDGFPAYEAYIKASDGEVITVYTYNPHDEGEGIRALFPPIDKEATRRISF